MFRALNIPERNRASLSVGLSPSGITLEMMSRHFVDPKGVYEQRDLITGYPSLLVKNLRDVGNQLTAMSEVVGNLWLPERRTYYLARYLRKGDNWVKQTANEPGELGWILFTWHFGQENAWSIILRRTEAEKFADLLDDYWTV